MVVAPALITASKIRHRKSSSERPASSAEKFDVVGIASRPADRLHGLLNDLIRGHPQLFLHVDRAGGNEGVDATGLRRLDRFAGTADVVFVGTRQRADRGILDRLSNGVNGIEITRRGCSKTGFDDIDLHALQLAGNTNLLVLGHRGAGTLLTVAQGGIKNNQTIFHA
jgi:hypothetical protein